MVVRRPLASALAVLAPASDEYFLLGDNRRVAQDSRRWGAISRAAIWAKVIDW